MVLLHIANDLDDEITCMAKPGVMLQGKKGKNRLCKGRSPKLEEMMAAGGPEVEDGRRKTVCKESAFRQSGWNRKVKNTRIGLKDPAVVMLRLKGYCSAWRTMSVLVSVKFMDQLYGHENDRENCK